MCCNLAACCLRRRPEACGLQSAACRRRRKSPQPNSPDTQGAPVRPRSSGFRRGPGGKATPGPGRGAGIPPSGTVRAGGSSPPPYLHSISGGRHNLRKIDYPGPGGQSVLRVECHSNTLERRGVASGALAHNYRKVPRLSAQGIFSSPNALAHVCTSLRSFLPSWDNDKAGYVILVIPRRPLFCRARSRRP